MHYGINRDTTKIPAFSSYEIKKYEYFTGEEIVPFNQSRMIEQAKFTYSPLANTNKKTNKNNWGSRRKTRTVNEEHAKQLANANAPVDKKNISEILQKNTFKT